MLQIEKIADKVWAIYGDTQAEVGKAFCRFQEYYENNEMKGKKNITILEIEEWWNRTKEEDHSDYYNHWIGFNLPGRVFLELTIDPNFRSTWMSDFWVEETQLLELISKYSTEEILTGYFIGLAADRKHDVLDHELAHAFFATNPIYKSSQIANVAKLPHNVYFELRTALVEMGYHPAVVNDEIQAYFGTFVGTLEEIFDTKEYDTLTEPFMKVFEKFKKTPYPALYNVVSLHEPSELISPPDCGIL